MNHLVGDEGIEHVFELKGLPELTMLTVAAEIKISPTFSGSGVGLCLLGFPSLTFQLPDVDRRDEWQRISVGTRLPRGHTRVVVALTSGAGSSGELQTRNWQVDAASSGDSITSHDMTAYEPVSIATLAEAGRGEPSPLVLELESEPQEEIGIVPIAFGQVHPPTEVLKEYPPGGWERGASMRPVTKRYLLRGALIHGEQGIVTVGPYVIREMFRLAALDELGAKWIDGKLHLPAKEPSTRVASAVHCFSGFPGNRNYAHWLVDILPAAMQRFATTSRETSVAFPATRASYQDQLLRLLPDVASRSIFVSASETVHCDELFVGPQSISDPGHLPSKRLMSFAQDLAARFVQSRPRTQRIYIDRRDTNARVLLNEPELIAALDAYGFQAVSLSSLTVEQQITLFANASHVVAAHGAGLANIAFCRPGTALIELFVGSYMQWSMRRLSSVVPVRYGCVIGKEVGHSSGQHGKKWTIDIAEVERAVRASLDT